MRIGETVYGAWKEEMTAAREERERRRRDFGKLHKLLSIRTIVAVTLVNEQRSSGNWYPEVQGSGKVSRPLRLQSASSIPRIDIASLLHVSLTCRSKRMYTFVRRASMALLVFLSAIWDRI